MGQGRGAGGKESETFLPTVSWRAELPVVSVRVGKRAMVFHIRWIHLSTPEESEWVKTYTDTVTRG